MPEILKATLEDVPLLNALINAAYRGESSKKGWTTEADLLGGIRTNEEVLTLLINHADTALLKYVNDKGDIQACVNLKQHDDKIYLGMLTVHPELQAKGIGKILLEAAEKYAAEKNCSSIYMTVISLRTELIEWYRRHGYRDTGDRKPFPENDPSFGLPKTKLEFIVMEKML